jgi:hypothetical protein
MTMVSLLFVAFLFVMNFHNSFQQQQQKQCDDSKGDQSFNVTLNANKPFESCGKGLISKTNSFVATVPNDTTAQLITCTVELDVVHGHEFLKVEFTPNKTSMWLGGGFSQPKFWSVAYRAVPAQLQYSGAKARFAVVATLEPTAGLFTCAVSMIDRSFNYYYWGSSFYRVWINTTTAADIPAENRAPLANPPLLALDQPAYVVALGNETTAFQVDVQAGDELVVQWAAMRFVAVSAQSAQFSLPAPTNWSDYNGRSPDLTTFQYYTPSYARATTPIFSADQRVKLVVAVPPEIANLTTSNTVNLITVQFSVNKPCTVASQSLLVGTFADGRICQLATTNQFSLSVTRRAALDIQITRTSYGFDFGFNVSIVASNGTVVFQDVSTVWTTGQGATSTRSAGTFMPGVYSVTVSRPSGQPVGDRYAIGFLENDCRVLADPDASCATNDTCRISGRCNMNTGACTAQANGTLSSACTPPARYAPLLAACQMINASSVPRFDCLDNENFRLQCTPRGSCWPTCNTGICCGRRCLCLPGTSGLQCLDPVDPPALLSQGTPITVDFAIHRQQLVGLGTETLRLFNWGNSGRVLKISYPSSYYSSLLDLAGAGNATRLVMQRRAGIRISVDDGSWPFVVSGCRFSNTLIDPIWMHHEGKIGWIVRNDNLNQTVWSATQATIVSPWANFVDIWPRLNSDQDVNVTDPRNTFGLMSLTLTLQQQNVPTLSSTTTAAITTTSSSSTTSTTRTTSIKTTGTTETTTSSSTTGTTGTTTGTSTTSPTTTGGTTSLQDITKPLTSVQPAMSPSASNTGLIVGLIIGALLLLLVAIGAVWWWRRNGTNNYRRAELNANDDNTL